MNNSNEERRRERVRCVSACGVRLFSQMNATSNIRPRISLLYVNVRLRLNNHPFASGHFQTCAYGHKNTHKHNTDICPCMHAQFSPLCAKNLFFSPFFIIFFFFQLMVNFWFELRCPQKKSTQFKARICNKFDFFWGHRQHVMKSGGEKERERLISFGISSQPIVW